MSVGVTGSNDSDKIPMSALSNVVPMLDDASKVITSHAAFTADSAILALIGKLQVASGIAYGAFPIPVKGTTNGSGVATLYITDNGLSTGNPIFTTIYEDGLTPLALGPSSNYQIVSIVVSGDKKSVAITVNQLGAVILGLVNVTSAAPGIEVRATVWGK